MESKSSKKEEKNKTLSDSKENEIVDIGGVYVKSEIAFASLNAVKLAYKAGLNIETSIINGFEFLEFHGYKVNQIAWNKYVANNINIESNAFMNNSNHSVPAQKLETNHDFVESLPKNSTTKNHIINKTSKKLPDFIKTLRFQYYLILLNKSNKWKLEKINISKIFRKFMNSSTINENMNNQNKTTEQPLNDSNFNKVNKHIITENSTHNLKINIYQVITIILFIAALVFITIYIPFKTYNSTVYDFIWSTNYNIDIKRYIIELVFITILFFSLFKSLSFLESTNYNDRKLKRKLKKEILIFIFFSVSMLLLYLYMYNTNIHSENLVFSPLIINLPVIAFFCFYILRGLFSLLKILFRYLNS